jgi:hypothetical protein
MIVEAGGRDRPRPLGANAFDGLFDQVEELTGRRETNFPRERSLHAGEVVGPIPTAPTISINSLAQSA